MSYTLLLRKRKCSIKHHYLKKNIFTRSLNMEDVTDADYKYMHNVWKEFVIKTPGEYHNLYIQSNKFLLADIFENFRSMCLTICELDPDCFLAHGLVW